MTTILYSYHDFVRYCSVSRTWQMCSGIRRMTVLGSLKNIPSPSSETNFKKQEFSDSLIQMFNPP